jgi:chemotaxis protein MotB
VLAAVLGFALAGGAIYYAINYRSEAKTSEANLAVVKKERDTLSKSVTQLDACTKQLDSEKNGRSGAEKDLGMAQASLASSQQELEELRKLRAENEARIKAFKDLTAKFQKMIDTGKLQVLIRNGKMTVKLPAGILFPSGKAELSHDGQMALMEVAVILKDLPDRHFMVVGHTDSVPLAPPSAAVVSSAAAARETIYKDNWELSTARAVEVTKFLVESGMNAKHVIAAGQAEHDPVGDNKSEAGRQENRRIEIVILPDVEDLPTSIPNP